MGIIRRKPETGEHDTHIVDVEIHLRKKTQSPGEVLLDLGPDGDIHPLGVAFLPLGTGKIRGDPRRNDRLISPVTGPLGCTSLENTLGGRDEFSNPGGGISRSDRVVTPGL